MKYVLEVGCVDRWAMVSPLGRILSRITELGSRLIRAEFMGRPNCRRQRAFDLGVATRVSERVIINELTDDVVIISDTAHVVVSAPDEVNKKIWIIEADSAVQWEETFLDAIIAMEGVAFAIHATGDTIVSGEIDISATMELPIADYRYISGRIRPDQIAKPRNP